MRKKEKTITLKENDKLYKISEIFYSLQGEGYHKLKPFNFIRFKDCNLKCGCCDTTNNIYKNYTKDGILKEIKSLDSGCSKIILTGGEPLLSIDKDLIRILKWEHGYRLHLETNGSLSDNNSEIIKGYKNNEIFDWITVSPKVSIDELKIKKGNELKVLYYGQNIEEFEDLDFEFLYIQPLWDNNYKDNLEKSIEFVKKNRKWMLSIQIHKYINIK